MTDRDPGPTTRRPTSTATSGNGLVAAILAGDLVALLGALATVVLGGPLAVSAGLLVVAVAMGWGIGTTVATVAGDRVSGDIRRWVAAISAALGVALGQLGLWLVAAGEGGALSLPDFLAQVYGPLVPLQAILAIAVAWRTAR